MISLKKTPEESSETMLASPEMPAYGYGTCISLDDVQTKALGLDKMPVGAKIKITAFGVIESARVEVGEDGNAEAPYLSIQLTDMEAAGASSVNAAAMYPSSQG